MLYEMFQQNASKLAKLLAYENPHNRYVILFVCFSFPATFMKNQKKNLYTYMGFRIPKVWQNLNHFAGTFHQA